jgi:hypothetical protein
MQTTIRANQSLSRRLVAFALLLGLTMTMLFAGLGQANAADPQAPAQSGPIGSSFMLSGSGYTANERIELWTTNPNGQDLTASYIYADGQGNFSLKVDTSDPQALATTSNYTTLTTNYDPNNTDADGNPIILSQYWELTLVDGSGAGSWHVTGQGDTSTVTQVLSFNLNN